ncbi:MAG TPA: phosphatase PAP2 family protein [Streptosporangiaceae bacterium]|nr:phosphatase PAP2 family protein [Streptosporangiaceae bacterium]
MASPEFRAVPDAGRLMARLAAGQPVPRTSGADGLDKTLFLDVNHFAVVTGWLHSPMYDYATYGIALFALLLVAGYWQARRSGVTAVAAAFWAGAGTVLAVAVTQPVNHAVAEARPWQSLPHALILAGHAADFSFPSDHAVMAGAVTAGLLIYSRRLGIVAAVAAVLLCLARVYIGAHYPQDVAAGLLLGAAVVVISYLIVRLPLRWLVGWLARTPLRPLVRPAAGWSDRRQPGPRAAVSTM